jgi:alpha 1,3-glucosidase
LFDWKYFPSTNTPLQEPYRRYNLDVFEYELDESMALYGAVPFLMSRSKQGVLSGLFFNNPSEIFVDVPTFPFGALPDEVSQRGRRARAEYVPRREGSGRRALTGKSYLPPVFALSKILCRWDYRDHRDVEEVKAKFSELGTSPTIYCG